MKETRDSMRNQYIAFSVQQLTIKCDVSIKYLQNLRDICNDHKVTCFQHSMIFPVLLLLLLEQVSLCGTIYSGTGSVDQVGLELRDLPASAS